MVPVHIPSLMKKMVVNSCFLFWQISLELFLNAGGSFSTSQLCTCQLEGRWEGGGRPKHAKMLGFWAIFLPPSSGIFWLSDLIYNQYLHAGREKCQIWPVVLNWFLPGRWFCLKILYKSQMPNSYPDFPSPPPPPPLRCSSRQLVHLLSMKS